MDENEYDMLLYILFTLLLAILLVYLIVKLNFVNKRVNDIEALILIRNCSHNTSNTSKTPNIQQSSTVNTNNTDNNTSPSLESTTVPVSDDVSVNELPKCTVVDCNCDCDSDDDIHTVDPNEMTFIDVEID